jgi:hypothetical protein
MCPCPSNSSRYSATHNFLPDKMLQFWLDLPLGITSSRRLYLLVAGKISFYGNSLAMFELVIWE